MLTLAQINEKYAGFYVIEPPLFTNYKEVDGKWVAGEPQSHPGLNAGWYGPEGYDANFTNRHSCLVGLNKYLQGFHYRDHRKHKRYLRKQARRDKARDEKATALANWRLPQ